MNTHTRSCGFFITVNVLLATASLPLVLADRSTSTVPEIGIRHRDPKLEALVGATIVIKPQNVIENSTLLIDKGIITAIGKNVKVPGHAHVLDMTGKTIYPALIDAYSEVEVAQHKSESAHWNKHVRPERDAGLDWKRSKSADQKLRQSGFALRLVAPNSGILKGKSAIVTTSDTPPANSIVRKAVANHVRLTAPRNAGREYPRSPMGAVALARQTCYDANWYRDAWRAHQKDPRTPRPETNVALEILSNAIQNNELFILDAPDEQYALRADRFAVEFDLTISCCGVPGENTKELTLLLEPTGQSSYRSTFRSPQT